MTNNESNAIRPGSARGRVARLTVGLVISSLAGALVAAWFVNRYVVFAVEQGKGQASVLVHTPLGSFPSGPPTATSSTRWSVVFPKSEWNEENDIDFYDGTAGNEEKVAQLTVLRFRINLPLAQVDDWYRQRLEETFTRTKGWQPKAGEQGLHAWLHSVRSEADPEALVYEQKMPDRVRGVMLQNQPDGKSGLATVYEFQEGRR